MGTTIDDVLNEINQSDSVIPINEMLKGKSPYQDMWRENLYNKNMQLEIELAVTKNELKSTKRKLARYERKSWSSDLGAGF